MLNFEWDPIKANKNLEKHNVSFKEAATVFADPLAETFYDPDHSFDEDRYISIGNSEFGRTLVVVFTDKNDIIRLISARISTKREQKHYEYGKE